MKIKLLILSIFLISCTSMRYEIITEKHVVPPHQILTLQPVFSDGNSTLLMPVTYYIPESYIITVIYSNKNGKIKSLTYHIKKEIYDTIKINQLIYTKGRLK